MKPSVIQATQVQKSKQQKSKKSTRSTKSTESNERTKRTVGKAQEFVEILKQHYPEAHCELDYSNSFELLVATILSAQCTDKRVNQVTPALFAQFPTPLALSQGSREEVEELVRSTGFYKNKAKSLIACSQMLVDRFNGEVPRTIEELTSLAGVGRKTANVVLGNAYGITSGIVVDTHVARLSLRFGWTQALDPVRIELDLQKIINFKDWILISHLLIWHGRRICRARNPNCATCFLFDRCPKKTV